MAAQGMRVLGVAKAVLRVTRRAPSETLLSSFWVWSGLPIRCGEAAAMRECRSAGIRVIMITGDYPPTARAIAEQSGIDVGDLVSGQDIARLDDAFEADRRKATQRRPPRDPRSPLFSLPLILGSLLQGATVLVAT